MGRFAPSPSGRMHLGNAFSALMTWLGARSRGGSVVMRVEDLDPRCQVPGLPELQIVVSTGTSRRSRLRFSGT